MLAAHVVWPSDDEIALLAARGVGVAHCPQSNMKIAAGIAPVPAMLRAGVAIGLGTDGAASNNDLDLWEEMDTAAKLHKVATGDATVVDARTALRMATIEGARALDLEDELGSLEPGKRADLIVIATDGFHQTPHFDPYSLLTYSTKAADVRMVIVDGRVVVEGGRVTTLDAARTLAEAERYRRALVADGDPPAATP
jgi:5-methylthioadenosine/S-adenosylhomocysteine deaminase